MTNSEIMNFLHSNHVSVKYSDDKEVWAKNIFLSGGKVKSEWIVVNSYSKNQLISTFGMTDEWTQ